MKPQNNVKTARFLLFFFSFFGPGALIPVHGQPYDPAAGKPGSMAIEASSKEIRFWANKVVELERGWVDISRKDSGKTSAGLPEFALGPAMTEGVVSLGDGGWITLGFPQPITNGEGPDFVVFENGFSDEFLELATVEVSSDGKKFVPFPAVSLTQSLEQVPPFGSLDAINLHNLAGKYRLGFGTGFDLEELKNEAELDVTAITAVRIRDVVGSLLPQFATLDSRGNTINDPWPTPFPTGGFDLDAVGVIHAQSDGIQVFPTMVLQGDKFQVTGTTPESSLEIHDVQGRLAGNFTGTENSLTASFRKGLYFVRSGKTGKPARLLVQ